DQAEKLRAVSDRLRAAEQEIAGRVQRVVEDTQHLLLRRRLQIDEEVSAAHQVHAGERRVLDQVLLGKNNRVADTPRDVIFGALLGKETTQPFRRNIELDVLRVASSARVLNRLLVHVGPANLD